MGRIFHPRKISAHVDEVCPLRSNDDGSAHYSWAPVTRHNAAGMVADLGRRLRGLHGQERCNLVCEAVWVDDEGIADLVAAAGGSGPASAGGEQGQP